MNRIHDRAAQLDDHLAQVLEAYLADLEAGTAPPREELLARNPELAHNLEACLASLEFIRRAARQSACTVSLRPRLAKIEAGETLGAYHLIREIGRGGMGVVYEAEGPAAEQRVAVKVLPLAAALDGRQLQRFKNEAQAAALLQHPHIVPVLDVGCAGDVHFYVMPLIEGHSLAEVIDELRRPRPDGIEAEAPSSARGMADNLASGRWAPPCPASAATRELAASGTVLSNGATSIRLTGVPFFRSVAHLGVQAAEALEQAHQTGILHRDIKPGNLLVDARGHLWVADFGLARLPGENGLTLTGDVVGTLRYMSPEQALGKRALVDQRTDVYSLGVTLYELLTLRAAFMGRDRQELLGKIAKEDPVLPRQLNRAIPHALETILLKAVAKEAAERYAMAQELADDLRRFLGGLAITARRPTPAQRLHKWGRRHRKLVASAAAFFLLAVAGLAISTVVVMRERDEAQRRAAQAWQAADEMYTQVAQEWLHHQPHLELVQREFLQKALGFFEDFARDQGQAPAARFQAARAARRVGDIRHKLGEEPAADQAYEQALTGLVALRTTDPGNLDYRRELANCQTSRGNFLRDTGRLADAADAYQEAHRLFEECAAAAPGDTGLREGRAGSLHNIGMVRHALGRTREAEADYRQALAEFADLRREQPDVPAYQHALASARNNLANLLRDSGRPKEALAAYRQADAGWQKLDVNYPGTPLYRQAQAAGASGLGVVLAALGRSEEAEHAHRRALALRQRLASDFPRVPAYRQALAASQNSLARLWAAAGKAPQSRAAYEQALALRQRLADAFPTVPAYRQELADTQHGLGSLLMATGWPTDAEQPLRAAFDQRQRLAAERPESAEARFDLLRSQRALAEVWQALGRLSKAETACREALALGLRLMADAPKIPAYRLELAATWNRLGLLLQATRRTEEAEKAHRQAQALRQQLAEEYPAAPYYRFEVAVGKRYLGSLLKATGRAPEAEDAYGQAIDIASRLAADVPKLPEYRWLLASCRQDLAELLTATGRTGDAEKELAHARPLWKELATEFPAYPDYHPHASSSEVDRLKAAGRALLGAIPR
jgi:eukaryotic-like serine/threonine-protein kinase